MCGGGVERVCVCVCGGSGECHHDTLTWERMPA